MSCRETNFTPGHSVGQWTLLEYAQGHWKDGRCLEASRWKCQCACGAIRWVRTKNLQNGQSKSCGCAYQGQWKSRNLRPVNSVFALGGA